ncbi:hypothetical protein JANAI62_07050 [Jannaschia pagri]|uniref:Uncharacterized protein n=1 Tax=Jannaschia pagri TaxID=2829797 RepID=A0ABQ4NI53_9RHOB|nr:hypothetical protein JANAI61_02690 [Jannaschia sp. AI_61]GIT94082.1 hypothetical protein JANAI62_07050 [Jannaschia sp. AI_62]
MWAVQHLCPTPQTYQGAGVVIRTPMVAGPVIAGLIGTAFQGGKDAIAPAETAPHS